MIEMITFVICLGLSSALSIYIVMKFDAKLDKLYRYQRKDIKTEMIMDLMPGKYETYNIVDLMMDKYPSIPYGVIHAKLKQLHYNQTIRYHSPSGRATWNVDRVYQW